MKITINGEHRVFHDGATLVDVLDHEAANRRGTAAAVDGTVVPRSEWATFVLADGQALELLTAVQGG